MGRLHFIASLAIGLGTVGSEWKEVPLVTTATLNGSQLANTQDGGRVTSAELCQPETHVLLPLSL